MHMIILAAIVIIALITCVGLVFNFFANRRKGLRFKVNKGTRTVSLFEDGVRIAETPYELGVKHIESVNEAKEILLEERSKLRSTKNPYQYES